MPEATIALVTGASRGIGSATCLAHGHPLEGAGTAKDSSRVELVRRAMATASHANAQAWSMSPA